MPSSSSSTLLERVGFRPRIPRFGRSPNPSSSRAKTPGTLRSASLTVKTRASSSTSELNTTAEPGIVSSLMRSPMTVMAGSSGASSSAAAMPAFDNSRMVATASRCERGARGREAATGDIGGPRGRCGPMTTHSDDPCPLCQRESFVFVLSDTTYRGGPWEKDGFNPDPRPASLDARPPVRGLHAVFRYRFRGRCPRDHQRGGPGLEGSQPALRLQGYECQV